MSLTWQLGKFPPHEADSMLDFRGVAVARALTVAS